MAWLKEVEEDLYSYHAAMIYAGDLRATGLFARVTQRGTVVTAWRDLSEIVNLKEQERWLSTLPER